MSEKSEREAKKARKQRKISQVLKQFSRLFLFDPFSPQSWSLEQANPFISKVKHTTALNLQAWGTFDFSRD